MVMEDLLAAIEAKAVEINKFVEHTRQDREAMSRRLDELDNALVGADQDLKRLSKANAALRGESPAQRENMMASAAASKPAPDRAYNPR